jgi:hypothetical protein
VHVRGGEVHTVGEGACTAVGGHAHLGTGARTAAGGGVHGCKGGVHGWEEALVQLCSHDAR